VLHFLLSYVVDSGYLPGSVEEWQELLKQFASVSVTKTTDDPDQSKNSYSENPPTITQDTNLKADSVKSSDLPDVITWENLALLLVKQLGPITGVLLLQEHNLSEVALPASFYRACLFGSLVHSQQRFVRPLGLVSVGIHFISVKIF
jgi:hypothetical protein